MDALTEAKALYNKKEYRSALKAFQFAQHECGDTREIQEWIKKCTNALNNATQPSKKSQAQSSSQTSKAKDSTPTTETGQTKPISQPQTIELSVSPTYLSFDDSGGRKTISVRCNTEWGFTYIVDNSNNKTSHFSGAVDKSKGELYVSCAANTTSSPQNATFKVFSRQDKTKYKIITLYQVAQQIYIYASSDGYTFSSSGGKHTVSISTNASDWYCSQMPSWMKYWVTSKNTMEIHCDPNVSASERQGVVELKTLKGDKSCKLTFTQTASEKKNATSSNNYRKTRYENSTVYDYMYYNSLFTINWAKIGIGYVYPVNIDISALDIRLWLFELSLASFEWQNDYSVGMWYWQPNFGVYVPFNDEWALKFSGGPKLNLNYGDADFLDLSWKEKEKLRKVHMDQKWWWNAQIAVQWNWGGILQHGVLYPI